MQLITDLRVMKKWHDLASDDSSSPFERVAWNRFECFSATGYSFMFNKAVIAAVCRWSKHCQEVELAAFFTMPDAVDFSSNAGFYGGMTFSADDDACEVEEMLFADQANSPFFSIYEASGRMFILPSDRRWALIGERDADLALFCFRSKEDREGFFKLSPSLETFETISDAARFAKKSMNYELEMKGA